LAKGWLEGAAVFLVGQIHDGGSEVSRKIGILHEGGGMQQFIPHMQKSQPGVGVAGEVVFDPGNWISIKDLDMPQDPGGFTEVRHVEIEGQDLRRQDTGVADGCPLGGERVFLAIDLDQMLRVGIKSPPITNVDAGRPADDLVAGPDQDILR
jgi:hypothetical protein